MGCVGATGGAVCGSDNRTYSSLCRLDLHNCARGGVVTPRCRGACPCRTSASAPACRAAPLADRLLDWFSVVMESEGGAAPPAGQGGFPRGCRPEARWMFARLDRDADSRLSRGELFALRHDAAERCLRPFLASCLRGRATRAAWCGCVAGAARPCRALRRAHPTPPPGSYVPACDPRGFYRPRQCHPALGICWCVDRHGAEVAGSRLKGTTECPGERAGAAAEVAGAGQDDEDAPGSGDNELRE